MILQLLLLLYLGEKLKLLFDVADIDLSSSICIVFGCCP
ncbi:hypothetical protein CISIN_1g038085mg, partial [Citrus sinensis]